TPEALSVEVAAAEAPAPEPEPPTVTPAPIPTRAPAPPPRPVPSATPVPRTPGGTTSVSVPNLVCDGGMIRVSYTAAATGELGLTRVRVTVDGRVVQDSPLSGQSYSNSITSPGSAGTHNISIMLENSGGQTVPAPVPPIVCKS